MLADNAAVAGTTTSRAVTTRSFSNALSPSLEQKPHGKIRRYQGRKRGLGIFSDKNYADESYCEPTNVWRLSGPPWLSKNQSRNRSNIFRRDANELACVANSSRSAFAQIKDFVEPDI